MGLKNEIKNVLKSGGELTVAGAKKAGELVGAFINYLNEKSRLQLQMQQQAQTQARINQRNIDLINGLVSVFQNAPLPVGLHSVLSLTPLYQNQVNGNIYDFGYSWTKNTTQIFCQIQCASIVTKLNQMLICGGCNFTIHQMIDKGVYFEIIIRTII